MKVTNASTLSQKKLTQEKRIRSTNVTKTPSKKRNNSNGKYDLSEQAFPFQASREDLTIDYSSIKKITLAKGNVQYVFDAHYHLVPVSVACLYVSPDLGITNLRKNVFYHEINMSDRLAACRGMNTHLFSFEAPMESPYTLGQLVKMKTAYCIVLPTNGCMELKEFMETCEEKYKNEGTEPLNPITFIQIAISLFAMLRDAHLQRIGLLSISIESLKISTDQTLYFDDFKSCVDLDVPNCLKEKPWIQLDKLTCPESESFSKGPYHESADVFAAAAVLTNLIKIPKKGGGPFYKSVQLGEVRMHTTRIRPAYLHYEDLLKRCLSFNPSQRPTASELLAWFEKQRKISLSDSK